MENEKFQLKCDITPLTEEYGNKDVCENNYGSEECNSFLLKKEILERNCSSHNDENNIDLYPSLDDPDFSLKIADKQEFAENSYDGTLATKIEDYAKKLIDSRYDMAPFQAFVKNYLSIDTPYNSLLLFHGTGTGKTCSALMVAEESRQFFESVGLKQKTFIVGPSIILDNFKSQICDANKLKEESGIWTFDSCISSSLLREVNPDGELGLSKEFIASKLREICDTYYRFFTYDEFYQFLSKSNMRDLDDHLIIIDEVHNIRKYDMNRHIKLAHSLELLSKTAENLRFVFLSATPIFYNVNEIVWLLNLMNAADRRAIIKENDVFDELGNMTDPGKELLIQKATGYVSFVKAENPYTFPYRVYPILFAKDHVFSETLSYPKDQIGNIKITSDNYIQHQANKLFICPIREKSNQYEVYKYLIEQEGLDNLQLPFHSLNMSYPMEQNSDLTELTGSGGLQKFLVYTDSKEDAIKGDFEYKKETLEKYGPIFSFDLIENYSSKIKNILDEVKKSKGILLIFSQFLDAGLIPVALALESIGFSRFNGKNLLVKKSENTPSSFQKYIFISADKRLSPDNKIEINAATADENKDGDQVKVILISKEGSEGVDFKNIRQVHILEPTTTMNIVEQIIGRAVRSFSHKDLPFQNRNVQLFLYGSLLGNSPQEPADLYFYRVATENAIKAGKVTRLLKQTSVDCVLHHEQNNFTQEILHEKMDGYVKQVLADGTVIQNFPVGDEPYSSVCDYMETCTYDCGQNEKLDETKEMNMDTYNAQFMLSNTDKIIESVKLLMKQSFYYKKDEIYKAVGNYSKFEIYAALTLMIEDSSLFLIDKFGRPGHLINIGDFYLFQPKEIGEKEISLVERSTPVSTKPEFINVDTSVLDEEESPTEIEQIEQGKLLLREIEENYNEAFESFNLNREDVGIKDPWYRIFGKIWSKMQRQNDDNFLKICVYHNIDILESTKKVTLLNFLSKLNKTNSVSEMVQRYFLDHSVISDDGKETLIFKKQQQLVPYQFNDSSDEWQPNETAMTQLQKAFKLPNFANIVGFIGVEERKGILTFKMKDMKSLKAAKTCDLERKERITDYIRSIYNGINLDFLFWNNDELCVMLETILRLEENDKKTCFLSPEKAIIFGLETS